MPRKYEVGDKVIGVSGQHKFQKGIIIAVSPDLEKNSCLYDIEYEGHYADGSSTKEVVKSVTKSIFRRYKEQNSLSEGASTLLVMGAKRSHHQMLPEEDSCSSDPDFAQIMHAIPPSSSSSASHINAGALISQHILRPLLEHPKYKHVRQDKLSKLDESQKEKRLNPRLRCTVCGYVCRSYCLQCSEKKGQIVAVHNPFPHHEVQEDSVLRTIACYISHITPPS